MRKLTLALMCLFVFMVGCSNEDTLDQSTETFDGMFYECPMLSVVKLKSFGENLAQADTDVNPELYFDLFYHSPSISIETIQYLVDNTKGNSNTKICSIRLSESLKSQISESLTQQTERKGFKFVFVDDI